MCLFQHRPRWRHFIGVESLLNLLFAFVSISIKCISDKKNYIFCTQLQIQSKLKSTIFLKRTKHLFSTWGCVCIREPPLVTKHTLTQIFINCMHYIVLEISILHINSQNWIDWSCLKLLQKTLKIQYICISKIPLHGW